MRIRLVTITCVLVGIVVYLLAMAVTPPTAPTNLTARAGPGRTLSWSMGWDRAAGYGPESITVNVHWKDVNGNTGVWAIGRTPQQMGCSIVTGGKYGCLDKITFTPIVCGPEDHYQCNWTVFKNGGDPSKSIFYGIYACDPGGCAPAPPRQPVWEPELSCIDNGGQGCESDYHPVSTQ